MGRDISLTGWGSLGSLTWKNPPINWTRLIWSAPAGPQGVPDHFLKKQEQWTMREQRCRLWYLGQPSSSGHTKLRRWKLIVAALPKPSKSAGLGGTSFFKRNYKWRLRKLPKEPAFYTLSVNFHTKKEIVTFIFKPLMIKVVWDASLW